MMVSGPMSTKEMSSNLVQQALRAVFLIDANENLDESLRVLWHSVAMQHALGGLPMTGK